ncbi:hypothetical protein D3C85_1545350 [compost metagenome]
MLAQAGHDVFGLAGGRYDGIAGKQGLLCDQCAETTGSSGNQPSAHVNSSAHRPCTTRGLLDELRSL